MPALAMNISSLSRLKFSEIARWTDAREDWSHWIKVSLTAGARACAACVTDAAASALRPVKMISAGECGARARTVFFPMPFVPAFC